MFWMMCEVRAMNLETFHLSSLIKRLDYLKKAPLDVGLFNQQRDCCCSTYWSRGFANISNISPLYCPTNWTLSFIFKAGESKKLGHIHLASLDTPRSSADRKNFPPKPWLCLRPVEQNCFWVGILAHGPDLRLPGWRAGPDLWNSLVVSIL